MIIRRKLFSKNNRGGEKKSDKNPEKEGNKSIAVGAGIVGAGTVGDQVLNKKIKDYMNTEASKEGEELFDKLKRYAERKGIKVDEVSETDMGPMYHKGTIYMDGTKSPEIIVLGRKFGGGKTGKGRHGSLISHELGHALFDKDKAKGVGEKIGKAAHKVYLKGGGAQHMIVAPIAGIAAGIRSGRKKAEKEAEGKEESKLNRHSAWGTSLAVQTPGLVSEGAASKMGYNLLKKAGASKKYLKHTRGKLLGAFGTYAVGAAVNSGTGELARGIAYKNRKKELKRRKKEEED